MKITKRQLKRIIRESISLARPKLVHALPPVWLPEIKKAWTVLIDGERIGEIAKIDHVVRDGGHYSDGSARVKGWQAYTGRSAFAKRGAIGRFRTKKEALDWLLQQ